MKRILVTRRLPPVTQKRLESLPLKLTQWNHYDTIMPRDLFINQSQEQDGILIMLTDQIDAELLEKTSLKAISTMSVGMDHIDLNLCSNLNIPVFNTPDVLTDATADTGIALILNTMRKIPMAINAVKTEKWKVWDPIGFCGSQLSGKKIGIVGMGRIGKALSKRLIPFQVDEILYCGKTKKELDFKARFVSFDQLLQESDVIVATCSLTRETMHLFNNSAFQKMKSSSILINIARGGVVDQQELVAALDTGLIAGAGLDVTTPEPLDPDHPLLTRLHDKVVVFPHLGSATLETREQMATLALDQLLQQLEIN